MCLPVGSLNSVAHEQGEDVAQFELGVDLMLRGVEPETKRRRRHG